MSNICYIWLDENENGTTNQIRWVLIVVFAHFILSLSLSSSIFILTHSYVPRLDLKAKFYGRMINIWMYEAIGRKKKSDAISIGVRRTPRTKYQTNI